LGFDPRNKTDKYCNYFDNNRNISLINRAYCADNPNNFSGYSNLVWGLTASDDPWGYEAHSPTNDNGTITPTAAISAMPYVPEESIATLKYFYHAYGDRLWGPFGFYDAFNPQENWFADTYLAIDQGTIVPMIENYRSNLLWDLFMSNPEIPVMLDTIGFVTGIADAQPRVIQDYQLAQNYPNPFNPSTTIQFNLKKAAKARIDVYNTIGQRVGEIVQDSFSRGTHRINFNANQLSSGVYYYRLQAIDSGNGQLLFSESKKMIVIH